MGLILTDKQRLMLKKPLGELVYDARKAKKYPLVVCVGDNASSTFIEQGLKPKIIVYDGKTSRKEVGVSQSIKKYPARQVLIKNEAGRLNTKAFDVFAKAFEDNQSTKIYVEGEEDLLALAALKKAPNKALVVYGQPGEGLVFVEANQENKKKVEHIIKEMTEDGHRSG